MKTRRRDFLQTSGALGLSLIGLSGRAAGAPAQRLSLDFLSDPDRIARLLPPPLQPADQPLLRLVCGVSGGESSAAVLVRAAESSKPGWFALGLWTSSERSRWIARESLGIGVKDGSVQILSAGDQLTATLTRAGRELFRLQTKATDQPAEPNDSDPLFAFSYRLNPNWTESAIDAAGSDMLRLEPPADEGAWRACDSQASSLDWTEASPFDPLAEATVGQILDVRWSLDERSLIPEESAAKTHVAANDFAPWAFLNYDRPIERGRAWTPPGWRDQTTALRLDPSELERYRQRKGLVADPLEIVEIQALISEETHRELLPPICRPTARPAIKIFGLRAASGDLSSEPYTELWLLAYAELAGRGVWYALSHMVGPGGDLIFGRDTWGYPSKSAEPHVVVTPIDFSVSCRRNGRELVYADGAFDGFVTGTSLSQLSIVSLQARPGGDSARLVYQQWYYQGRRNRINPSSLALGFAAPDDPDALDPWHELNPAQLNGAAVYDSAVMQRSPGEVLAEVEDFQPYYRERCDGILPWDPAPLGNVPPTLRVLPGGSPTRS